MPEELVGEFILKCGDNAGRVWAILNEKGPLRQKEIQDKSRLNNIDFHTAVGWLARENKISKDSEGVYKLDATNLTSLIGTNAGRVWKTIDIWGEIEFNSIKRLTDVTDEEVYSALGWLAREHKVDTDNNRYILK